jgi:hypothetical protein
MADKSDRSPQPSGVGGVTAAKWVHFEQIGSSKSGKTKIFDVLSNESGINLGEIRWHAPWRCYAFFPEPESFFERTCLSDIARFIRSQMRGRR